VSEKKTYRVGVIYHATQWVEVEASTPEEASNLAMQKCDASLCYHCSTGLDLEDPFDTIIDQ
jgi:hypothetical protein